MENANGNTLTELNEVLEELDRRSAALIDQIKSKQQEKLDIQESLRTLGCYYRRYPTQIKKYTFEELLKDKKDLTKYDPTKKSHGDCGWKKDRWNTLTKEIKDLERALAENEGQITIAREGITKTADAQDKVYETQKTLEEAQKIDSETMARYVKLGLLVLTAGLAVFVALKLLKVI